MQVKTANFRTCGMLIAAAALIAGCTVSDESAPSRQQPPNPQLCTREYAPVCGVHGSVRQTFGNACEARSRGYRIIGTGECSNRGTRPGAGWNKGPDRPMDPVAPSMCTQQYEPVCARRGESVRSFGNACEARNAGYRIIGEGRC